MEHVPLVSSTRGGEVECVHYGAIAVVDVQGKLQAHAGNPDLLTFARSTTKPFQALPFMNGQGPAHFGLRGEEIALLCASHSGEEMHVKAAERILHVAGCGEPDLQCGCHVPIVYSALDRTPPADAAFNQLHNNCSGKHAGFLAYCSQHNLPRTDYIDPRHPLQQAVKAAVGRAAGVPATSLVTGIDGCSAPTFGLPLSRLAMAYARLSAPAQQATDADSDSMAVLFDAMTRHPDMVSGQGRSDLAFMRSAPGDVVAKIGADGVQGIGIRSAGLGIAIKIADGNQRALCVAAVEVLRALGLLSGSGAALMQSWARPAIQNLRGIVTGEVAPVFKLAGR